MLFTFASCENLTHDVKALESKANEDEFVYANAAQKSLPRTMSLSEFVKWIADPANGYHKKKSIGEIDYSLRYMPAELLALSEVQKEEFDFVKIRKVSQNYSDLIYFNLRIEIPSSSGEVLKYQLSSPQQYDQRVKYLSFGLEQDICVVQKKDTIRPALYHFERTFEVVPYATVMMAFDPKYFKIDQEFSVVINDKLFDKGYLKFNYKNGQLSQLPTITEL